MKRSLSILITLVMSQQLAAQSDWTFNRLGDTEADIWCRAWAEQGGALRYQDIQQDFDDTPGGTRVAKVAHVGPPNAGQGQVSASAGTAAWGDEDIVWEGLTAWYHYDAGIEYTHTVESNETGWRAFAQSGGDELKECRSRANNNPKASVDGMAQGYFGLNASEIGNPDLISKHKQYIFAGSSGLEATWDAGAWSLFGVVINDYTGDITVIYEDLLPGWNEIDEYEWYFAEHIFEGESFWIDVSSNVHYDGDTQIGVGAKMRSSSGGTETTVSRTMEGWIRLNPMID